MTPDDAEYLFAEALTVSGFALESRHAFANQKVPYVTMRRIFAGALRFFSHAQDSARDFGFARFCAPAEAFDYVSIAISSREIQARVNARGVFRQFWIDQAYSLKKISPVQRRE